MYNAGKKQQLKDKYIITKTRGKENLEKISLGFLRKTHNHIKENQTCFSPVLIDHVTR